MRLRYNGVMASQLALGMRIPTAEEQAAALTALLAYAAGYIEDPGDDDGTWSVSSLPGYDHDDTVDPPFVRCKTPRASAIGWRAMRRR
jgi:hypothetical protein